jgi:hypothetical protein
MEEGHDRAERHNPKGNPIGSAGSAKKHPAYIGLDGQRKFLSRMEAQNLLNEELAPINSGRQPPQSTILSEKLLSNQ